RSKKQVQGETAAPAAATEDEAAKKAAEEARMKAEQQRKEADAMAKQAFTNDDIYFDFDSAVITSDAQILLRNKAAYMRSNANIAVQVEGHCDERGTEAYNMALGERRAESAKSFMVNMGIDAAKISTISYGKERPVDKGHNEAAWAKNRRAHFVIK
ncbi:MAG: peptidoglycan-associated lipoprotein Pal, partial [Desulfobacteraceae bacterium]|nr:peptidoglycan-associated lipoprotein Pal [Desulfobacteraceae bacterium]